MAVNEGRWTANIDGDFVVFIIGARVGNPLKSWRAVPLLAAMRRMLADLEKDPSAGLLGFQQHGITLVQYWRSFEDLEHYARNPAERHAKVWRNWYRLAQHKNSSVGIWHETFKVRAGEYEAIYQNMKTMGLMKAGTPEPVSGRGDSARGRLGMSVPAESSSPVDGPAS
jgi:hypothetical protein